VFILREPLLRKRGFLLIEAFKMLDVIELENRVAKFLEDRGFSLADFQVSGSGRAHTFRVFVERLNGESADINDCAWLSPVLSVFLESLGVYEANSVLEVSSPGLDRTLKKDSDFERFKGRLVRVTALSAGKKLTIEGTLLGLKDDDIVLMMSPGERVKMSLPGFALIDQELHIRREIVERVRLKPEV